MEKKITKTWVRIIANGKSCQHAPAKLKQRAETPLRRVPNTVKDNPQLSKPQGPGTSKLDWRYFEHNRNDRNELQICKKEKKQK